MLGSNLKTCENPQFNEPALEIWMLPPNEWSQQYGELDIKREKNTIKINQQ